MIQTPLITELEALVGKENVLADTVDLVAYSYDATADVPHQKPDVVVFPASSEEVQKIVNLARTNKVPIYPRGSGTNLSGGTTFHKRRVIGSWPAQASRKKPSGD